MKRVWVVLLLIFIIAIIIFSVNFFNLKQNEKILVQNKTAKIVFTTDKTYQDYLKVTIKSAIENKNADSIYDISILSVDLSTEEMQYFKNMSAKNVVISTIPLEVSSLKVGNFPIANKRVSRADLFKFFMPEIFEDCDRILYIDSDTLILGDLLDLYNTNMHGKCLGAVIKYVPKYSWIKIIPRIWYVKSVKYDYNCDYDIWDLILIFFNVANIGWLWEILLCLIFEERLVNKGTMLGPWLPIYGFGAVFIIALLKKYRQKPYQLFLMAFLLCGILEYGTAWYLETFKGLKWWDYTGFFLNIHGRVCLEGLMLFGFGGCILTYMVCPLLKNIYKKIKPNVKKTICIILVCLYLIDLGYSHFYPNTGVGITSPAKININIDRN